MSLFQRSTLKVLFRFLLPVCFLAGSFIIFSPAVVNASENAQDNELLSPLEIVDIRVDHDPAVGVPFELRVTLSSIPNLENVKLVVDTPGAVQIISGKKITKLSLSGGLPLDESFTLVTKQPGEWAIAISVTHKNGEFGLLSDMETIGIISKEGAGTFLREEEIVFVQSDVRQPQVEPLSLNQTQSQLAAIPILDSDEIQLTGTIRYESISYDGDVNGNGDLTDDDIPNGARPLPRAIVELWDRHPDGDFLLDITRADENGNYEFYPVPNRAGINLYLRVYASDFERVRVVDNLGWIFFHDANYLGSTQDGIHTFNYTIPLSPAGSLFPTEQAFYVYDLLANVGYVFMQDQIDWDDSRLLTVHWPKNCILGIGGACFRGDVYLLLSDAKSPDVTLHEYGHFVLSEYIGSLDVITACIEQGFKHYFWRESNETCAWSEGWADFFEMAVQNDPDYRGNNHEDVDNHIDEIQRLGGNPEAYEDIVAAVLWDIFDSASPSESFDEFFDEWNGPSQNGIWTFSSSPSPILFHRHPFTLSEFWTVWKAHRPENACYGSAIFQHHLLEYSPFMYSLQTNYDASHGTITVLPAPGCPEQTYLEGTTVEFQATPKSGYVFDSWEIETSGSNPVPNLDLEQPNLTLTMDQDWIVTAKFVLEPTPTPTPTPSPTPSPSSITLTITGGNNDAGPNPDMGCSKKTYWNEIYLGECFNGQDITSGFRFTNAQIPQGATITEAYLRFTTNGPYSNALSLRIFGEANGNPNPFTDSSMPSIRIRTSTYRDWSIPSSDTWGLGNERNTPDLSEIIQEIINRNDWHEGNSLALLVTDNGNEGGQHRRVIAYERLTSTYTGHLAELVITYSTGGATPSPTPSPTATQDPGGGGGSGGGCTCAILCTFGIGNANVQNPVQRLVFRVNGLMKLAPIPWQMIETLQALRDEIMTNTEEGQHYVDLYTTHSPELAVLLLEHDDLWEKGLETIDLFIPAFEAMINGRSDEIDITGEQIQALDEFLQLLQSYANMDLQGDIETELQLHSFSELEGQSFAEAQGQILGNAPPELDIGGPFSIDEGSEISLSATAIDPDDEVFEYSWDLDGDGIFETTGQIVQYSATSLDGPAVVEIEARVCDLQGACDRATSHVSIFNVPPHVNLGPDRQSYEGNEVFFEVQVEDPGISDTFTLTWSLGEGTSSSQVFELSHTYGDNGTYEVTVFVEDDDGGSDQDELLITVLNQAPDVEIDTTGMLLFNGGRLFLGTAGQAMEFDASAIDPGTDDLLFEWGFGSIKAYLNNGQSSDLPQSPEGIHPFIAYDTSAGVFYEAGITTLSLDIYDDDGGTSQSQVPVMVLGNDLCSRSQGFWKHQLSNKGKKQIDEARIDTYLDIVNFASSYFSETVDGSNRGSASDIMNPKGSDMRGKAQAQLLTAWFNFANGSVGWTEKVDIDGDGVVDKHFFEAILQVEDTLRSSDATHEDLVGVKDIAERINSLNSTSQSCNP